MTRESGRGGSRAAAHAFWLRQTRDPWQLASWIGLLVLLGFAPSYALDSGITWDEEAQLEYGNRVLAWFRSGFSDRSAFEYRDLFLYGGLFDLPAQWIVSKQLLPWGPYESRHVLTALVALLGVLAASRTAARIAGARAGFLAATVLVLTPCWVGHGMFNPKDIPFGAAAAFVAHAMVCIVMRPGPLRGSDALRCGLAVGAALGVRSGGMFLLAYPVLAAGARLLADALVRARRREPQRIVRPTLITLAWLAAALPLAWGLMISAWPWAQVDPLARPFEAAKIAAQFHWNHPVLFAGRFVMSTELPWSYLPTWFAITLPELYLLAALCGSAAFAAGVRARTLELGRTLAVLMLIGFVAAPLAGVLIKRPVVYDAQRHFLFFLPPLAALAGLAFDAFLSAPAFARLRKLGIAAIVLPAALTLADMASLHPYEYVYFNRLSGGLPHAFGRYETDYWGASYREGFEWLMANVNRPGERTRIAACEQNHQLRYLRKQTPGAADRFRIVRNESSAQFYLAFTRNNCHQTQGQVIHKITRQGAPLLYILKR